MMLSETPLTPGYIAAKRFLRDHPGRIQIVRACIAEAERTRGEFAGAWVLQEAQKLGVRWFPNLRSLASYGILRRTDVSRGGRRAYYAMPDVEGVKAALREFQINA
jgi:hypothetical protein